MGRSEIIKYQLVLTDGAGKVVRLPYRHRIVKVTQFIEAIRERGDLNPVKAEVKDQKDGMKTVLTWSIDLVGGELYRQCLAEAEKLETKHFMPALDMIEEETLSSILFKVLIEHDIALEGHLDAPSSAIASWSRRVSKFFVKWRHLLPEPDRQQYMSFKQSKGGN